MVDACGKAARLNRPHAVMPDHHSDGNSVTECCCRCHSTRTRSALLKNRCQALRFGSWRPEVPAGLALISGCRPVMAWLPDDVPACRDLAAAWLVRGATPGRSGIRHARRGPAWRKAEGKG